jgi:nucleotide-binding universal stress UspA family protein
MKRILVPIDFSNCSLHALEFASVIAKKSGSGLTLFNVQYNPSNYVSAPNIYTALNTVGLDSRRLFIALKSNIEKSLNDLKTKRYMEGVRAGVKVVSSSSVYKSILDYAEKSQFDIIIMGTNGANKFTERLIGTNAERIVRFTSIPVMVVSKHIKRKKIENIVFPTDLTQKASRVFKFVKYFSDLFGAKIHILRVNLKSDHLRTSYAMGRMGLLIKNQEGNFATEIVDSVSVEKGIIDYSRKVNADVIAIGARKRKGAARYFTDRITESILRLSDLPVLTIDLPKK